MITEKQIQAASEILGMPWDSVLPYDMPQDEKFKSIVRMALEAVEQAAWQPIDTLPSTNDLVMLGTKDAQGFYVYRIINPARCVKKMLFTHWRPSPEPPTDHEKGLNNDNKTHP